MTSLKRKPTGSKKRRGGRHKKDSIGQGSGGKNYYDMVDRLSREQIEEIEESFKFFDKNGDGSIEGEELSAVMRSLGMELDDIELEKMIAEFDIDGNGTIDYDEFLKMMAKKILEREQSKTEKEVQVVFDVFDHDKNGFIGNQDLKYLFKCMGESLTDDEINDMIELADGDGDGMVGFTDFLNMAATIGGGVRGHISHANSSSLATTTGGVGSTLPEISENESEDTGEGAVSCSESELLSQRTTTNTNDMSEISTLK